MIFIQINDENFFRTFRELLKLLVYLFICGTMSSLSDQRKDLAGMRMHIFVSPAQTAFYIILVIMGILGNTTVILVIGKSIILEHNWGRNSDIIIVNMATSNLLVSLLRNTLLIISEFGLQVLSLSIIHSSLIS